MEFKMSWSKMYEQGMENLSDITGVPNNHDLCPNSMFSRSKGVGQVYPKIIINNWAERDSLTVSVLPCHAADPGSKPAQGDDFLINNWNFIYSTAW